MWREILPNTFKYVVTSQQKQAGAELFQAQISQSNLDGQQNLGTSWAKLSQTVHVPSTSRSNFLAIKKALNHQLPQNTPHTAHDFHQLPYIWGLIISKE